MAQATRPSSIGADVDLDQFISHASPVRLRKLGRDSYVASCPCPDHGKGEGDCHPSLSISAGRAGGVVLFCHVGCTVEAIVAAYGLTMADLRNGKGRPENWAPTRQSGKLAATYKYLDESGKLLFKVIRYEPKDFRQCRPDGDGGWVWKLGDTRRVLFRLPELLAGIAAREPVYVVEGEKDVEALRRAGCVATCNSGGAGKWKPQYSETLRGANVIVVADRDEPGRKHGAQVAASLEGLAASVCVVEAKTGKDASDHLAAGYSIDEFVSFDVSNLVPGAAQVTEQDSAQDQAAELPPDEGRTDTGNANRFVRLYGDRVRHSAVERLWYHYDGTRWASDDRLFVEDAIGQVALSIFEDAARASDSAEARKIAAWATHSLSSAARKAALECARSDPRIVICPDDFDRDGWLLNCLNGTLDLHSGELRPHDPADLISKLAPVVYDPEARSELWERVLEEATGHDPDYLRHLRRFLGSCLTTNTEAEFFAIALGGTETCKSTILGPVRKVMGDYAADVEPATFYVKDRVGGTRDDLVRLAGVRLALIGEASRHKRMDEALLKKFVSGEAITERGIYQRDRELRPVAKLVMHTNELPQMSDDDDAVWRRALSWPFTHRPEHIDTTIKPTLLDLSISGPAILRWLVQGCLAWQLDGAGKAGLGTPTTVDQAKAVMQNSMNPLLDFFDEVCDFDADLWCSRSTLRKAYMEWSKNNGVRRPLGTREFTARMRAQGCLDETGTEGGRGVRGWSGVGLKGESA